MEEDDQDGENNRTTEPVGVCGVTATFPYIQTRSSFVYNFATLSCNVGILFGSIALIILQLSWTLLESGMLKDIWFDCNTTTSLKMHILLTILHTFLMEPVWRICLNIKTTYPW